jgi:hypothetical protein
MLVEPPIKDNESRVDGHSISIWNAFCLTRAASSAATALGWSLPWTAKGSRLAARRQRPELLQKRVFVPAQT